jgi:hypothetical protein
MTKSDIVTVAEDSNSVEVYVKGVAVMTIIWATEGPPTIKITPAGGDHESPHLIVKEVLEWASVDIGES